MPIFIPFRIDLVYFILLLLQLPSTGQIDMVRVLIKLFLKRGKRELRFFGFGWSKLFFKLLHWKKNDRWIPKQDWIVYSKIDFIHHECHQSLRFS